MLLVESVGTFRKEAYAGLRAIGQRGSPLLVVSEPDRAICVIIASNAEPLAASLPGADPAPSWIRRASIIVTAAT
jgi:hypothetical protein